MMIYRFLQRVMFMGLTSFCVLMFSCSDEQVSTLIDETDQASAVTRAVPTPYFDWENADWMPTPSGQSRIPSPWVGAGSLVSTYGIEIINDRRASDGWELMYSSFDANAPGNLVNPYFVLYNKYRGNMRIFLYLTSDDIEASDYLQDGIYINSGHSTSLLNFLGESMVDATKNKTNYQQVQPAPLDGSAPLAAYRWYMMEYEMAYDPNLAFIPYNEIQMYWRINYQAITKFSFGGTLKGKLEAIMGSSSSNNPITTAAGKLGTTIGTGVLAGVGHNFLKNAATDPTSGANNLGISNSLFKLISKGVDSAVSGAFTNLPGAVIGLLNAIIGGGNSPKPVSYSLDANISLEGTSQTSGAFPSSPISFWVPGTNILPNAVGYIPLYNKTLGVVNFVGNPVIYMDVKFIEHVTEVNGQYELLYTESLFDYPVYEDYSKYLVFNPEVLRIADINITNSDIVVYDYTTYFFLNDLRFPCDLDPHVYGVRFVIEVTPKDGSPSSTIVKTFRLESEIVNWTVDTIYHLG